MVTITTSLPVIAVLKTDVNHRKQNPPKLSSYVISQLHFFLDRHTRKKAVPFRYSLSTIAVGISALLASDIAVLVCFEEVCDELFVVCRLEVSKSVTPLPSFRAKNITEPIITAQPSHISGFGEYLLLLPLYVTSDSTYPISTKNRSIARFCRITSHFAVV